MHLGWLNSLLICASVLFFAPFGLSQDGSSVGSGFKTALALHPSSQIRTKTAESETTRYIGDLRLGYVLQNNLYLGAIVSIQDEHIVTTKYATPSDNNNIKRSRNSTGLSIGYNLGNWYTIASYYFSSTWKESSTAAPVVYQGGSGVQLDIGVKILIFPHVYFAPQLSYQLFAYSEYVSSGVTIKAQPELIDRGYQPVLVFGIEL